MKIILKVDKYRVICRKSKHGMDDDTYWVQHTTNSVYWTDVHFDNNYPYVEWNKDTALTFITNAKTEGNKK